MVGWKSSQNILLKVVCNVLLEKDNGILMETIIISVKVSIVCHRV